MHAQRQPDEDLLETAIRNEENRLLGLTVGELLAEQDVLPASLSDVATIPAGADASLRCTLDLRAIIDLLAARNAAEDQKVAEWRAKHE